MYYSCGNFSLPEECPDTFDYKLGDNTKSFPGCCAQYVCPKKKNVNPESYGKEETIPELPNRNKKESYGVEETIPALPNRNTKESYREEETIPELPNNSNTKESYGKEETIPELPNNRNTKESYGKEETIPESTNTNRNTKESYGKEETIPESSNKNTKELSGKEKTIPELLKNIFKTKNEVESSTQSISTQPAQGNTAEGEEIKVTTEENQIKHTPKLKQGAKGEKKGQNEKKKSQRSRGEQKRQHRRRMNGRGCWVDWRGRKNCGCSWSRLQCRGKSGCSCKGQRGQRGKRGQRVKFYSYK